MANTENINEEELKQEETTNSQEEAQEATETAENTEATETENTEEAKDDSEIKKLEAQLADMKDKYLRLTAEYDNYRKRTAAEKTEILKSAGEGVLKGLLPVMDDFERALTHMNDAGDVAQLRTGVELIHKKFVGYLEKNGVTEIPAKGETFDSEVHEAITMMPAPSEDMKGKCFDCVEKGYKLGDKVMRFAKVVVCQ